MKKILLATLLSVTASTLWAQRTLTLDECRQLALTGNKEIAMSRQKMVKAENEQQAARTNYLPKISLRAGYVRTGREISILSDEQKSALRNLGTNLGTTLTPLAMQFMQQAQPILAQHPELAQLLNGAAQYAPAAVQALNSAGTRVAKAFETDTRNIGGAALMLTQPLYMGGKIRAYDRITQYSKELAGLQLSATQQETILSVDQAYWQVISLAGKQRLAKQYLEMLQNMLSDTKAMVAEGVATHANELTVNVKVNEAEMTLTKIDDGLQLSRMLLCQLCNLPLSSDITLADETATTITSGTAPVTPDTITALRNRPELAQLQTAINIYKEKEKIERAAYLPQVALVGGYGFTTPNLYNGFSNKLKGDWAVGVTLSLPVWNWGETRYKLNAARAETRMQQLRLEEAGEKISLQVNQTALQLNQANKKLHYSQKNLEKAEENLRIANVGFREGVITTSDALAAQTAWMQAQSDYVDAQVDLRLCQSLYQKALGLLR